MCVCIYIYICVIAIVAIVAIVATVAIVAIIAISELWYSCPYPCPEKLCKPHNVPSCCLNTFYTLAWAWAWVWMAQLIATLQFVISCLSLVYLLILLLVVVVVLLLLLLSLLVQSLWVSLLVIVVECLHGQHPVEDEGSHEAVLVDLTIYIYIHTYTHMYIHIYIYIYIYMIWYVYM